MFFKDFVSLPLFVTNKAVPGDAQQFCCGLIMLATQFYVVTTQATQVTIVELSYIHPSPFDGRCTVYVNSPEASQWNKCLTFMDTCLIHELTNGHRLTGLAGKSVDMWNDLE